MKTGTNENVFFEPQSIVKDLFNFNFCLTYLSSMFEFYTPRKRQKTKGYLDNFRWFKWEHRQKA